jgi:hypothetical protein
MVKLRGDLRTRVAAFRSVPTWRGAPSLRPQVRGSGKDPHPHRLWRRLKPRLESRLPVSGQTGARPQPSGPQAPPLGRTRDRPARCLPQPVRQEPTCAAQTVRICASIYGLSSQTSIGAFTPHLTEFQGGTRARSTCQVNRVNPEIGPSLTGTRPRTAPPCAEQDRRDPKAKGPRGPEAAGTGKC